VGEEAEGHHGGVGDLIWPLGKGKAHCGQLAVRGGACWPKGDADEGYCPVAVAAGSGFRVERGGAVYPLAVVVGPEDGRSSPATARPPRWHWSGQHHDSDHSTQWLEDGLLL
jgi:hypothetical protein